ncbi:hypothetical protein Q5P01_007188 [Channa striata]|uniref:Uncharacterized protein n=1 Tax=Channa striata TaxID=64152 RepID=A0AA88N695_CHASR|nr:hypothetical protein Q5P01_007188 [Channa striata]
MQNLRAAGTGIINQVFEQAGVYATVMGMFSYNFLYDKSFVCSKPAPQWVCWTYMLVPVLLILVLRLWMDRSFRRDWKLTLARDECTCGGSCYFWTVLCTHILKSLFVGLLWCVSVLVDGDWYVCCSSCCNVTLTNAELKSDLANESRIQGLILLTGLVSVAAFFSSLPRRKCSTRAVDVVRIILEEGENLGTESLRTAAKTRLAADLNRHLSAGQWEKCFGVAEELIKKVSSASQPEDGRQLDVFALSSPSVQQAACENNGTQEKSIDASKNKSRIWGLIFLTVVVCAASFLTSIAWRKCSKQHLDAAEMVLEEGENLATNRLMQVKAKLEKRIESYFENQRPNWRSFHCAAEKMIMDELFIRARPPSASAGEPPASEDAAASGSDPQRTNTEGGDDSACLPANQVPDETGASASGYIPLVKLPDETNEAQSETQRV